MVAGGCRGVREHRARGVRRGVAGGRLRGGEQSGPPQAVVARRRPVRPDARVDGGDRLRRPGGRRRSGVLSRRRRPAAADVLLPLDAPGRRGPGGGQLAAGHLRPDAVRRRDAAPDDRDRLPRDGLGGRRPGGAVPGARPRLGLLPAAARALRRDARGSAVTSAVADDLWSAVGDPTRRRMLDLLLVEGEGTATTLSRQMPVTRQAVAKHLAVLDRVGLVRVTPAGRERRYRVDDAELTRAVALLSAVGAAWDARPQRIKQIAEAIQRTRQH